MKRTCDPECCDCCVYICEGDFFCDKCNEIVIDDWEPTEFFEMCKNRKEKTNVQHRKNL